MNSSSAKIILFLSGCIGSAGAFAFFGSAPDIDEYERKAIKDEYSEIINAPEICDVISDEACSMLIRKPSFEISYPDVSLEDRRILNELLLLSGNEKQDVEEISSVRKGVLKNSAVTLGFEVGMAMEAARFNREWSRYKHLYEKINFESLMLDHKGGKNIVPPVIYNLGSSVEISAGGRVFRAAGTTYKIKSQPRFSKEAPTWRDYLHIDIKKPRSPISALLPKTTAEREFWRAYLIRGYAKGVRTVSELVEAQYRELQIDYIGMITYQLLRTYNMISAPIVETNENPVALLDDGSAMAIDDMISVLTVRPKLNQIRETWKLYPQLKKLSDIQRNIIERNKSYVY